jgi:tRNA threonylcarbamoyladenosine biosynthesis protein TsaE
MSGPRVITTRSEEETFELARTMAAGFNGTETVLLEGELGAGKTIFAKGLAAGAGIADAARVSSPSFTLVNVYRGKCPIYHIDLYRLERPAEIADLGWEDMLGQGIVIVEWAEKMPFPVEGIRVRIEPAGDDTRLITIE